MSAEEYLTPSQRAEKINTSFICSTRWTKLMLLRMQQLDRSGLNEGEIFMHLRAEFNAPATVEELQQERAFSKMEPTTQIGFWNSAMENMVIELNRRGVNAQAITKELWKVHRKPASWTETYRKMQQMKLDGTID
ncbi:MAG: hypothetical protein LQ352_002143 [Teloschistes flavicans]|nr:MAG: hypothetical protein LQ352_002143 [Teloschistes flavicans]